MTYFTAFSIPANFQNTSANIQNIINTNAAYLCKIRINMNKLKICNISLLAITPAVLATLIILEASHGESVLGLKFNFWVIIHLVAVLTMTGLVCWHLRMNWAKSPAGQRNSQARPLEPPKP